MANFVLQGGSIFPVGTSVSAYLVSREPGPGDATTPPVSAAVETQEVGADSTATFVKLADGVPYFAAAQVAGTWRRVQFRVAPAPAGVIHHEAAPGSSGVAIADVTRYCGFTLRETGGTDPATVVLHDGTVDGDIIEEIQLCPGESARELYAQGTYLSSFAIYFDLVAGTVEGSVRYIR